MPWGCWKGREDAFVPQQAWRSKHLLVLGAEADTIYVGDSSIK